MIKPNPNNVFHMPDAEYLACSAASELQSFIGVILPHIIGGRKPTQAAAASIQRVSAKLSTLARWLAEESCAETLPPALPLPATGCRWHRLQRRGHAR